MKNDYHAPELKDLGTLASKTASTEFDNADDTNNPNTANIPPGS